MIETVMIAALGALASALVFLALLPFVNRRAARLALRRLEWRLPASPAEIAADRDRLRAELAVKERQAEQRIESAEAARIEDQTEVGRRLVELHARAEEIALLQSTLAARKADIETLTEAKRERDSRIAGLQTDLSTMTAARDSLDLRAETLTRDLSTAHERAASLRIEIDTLEAANQAQTLRIGDAEAENRRLQGKLTDKTEEARQLERKLRDAESALETMTKARDRLDKQSAARQESIGKLEIALTAMTTDRDQKQRELALESRSRAGLEDEIDRTATRLATLEYELAELRRAHVETNTALAMRTGEVSTERQARKAAEQSRREAERKVEAVERRAASAAQARQGSETARIAALEKELRNAAARETDLASSLDRTRREAQETARDLSKTIAELKKKTAAPPEPKRQSQRATVAIEPAKPPSPSNDVALPGAPDGQDPRTAIAAMRERLRSKLEDEPVEEPQRPSRRAIPPGE
jgi:chromosome segregation ATPase